MSLLIYKTAPEWIEYAKSLPDPEMLFDSFWFEGELCLLFSDTNSGKTALAFQIAQSIASGKPIHQDIKMNANKQPVLLCEFELSEKQFESRFKDKETGERFDVSKDVIRAQLDYTHFNPKDKLEDLIIQEIKTILKKTNIKIVIIDNLAYIEDTGKTEGAVEFMRNMKKIKKEMNLSILVLGHAKKRKLTEPMTQNDLSGSKKYIDFSDSCFIISNSSKSKSRRYLKQLKVREESYKYTEDTVLDTELQRKSGMLCFDICGQSPEFTHLKKINPNENRNQDIIEAHNSGDYTQKQLAEKFDLSDRQIRRILENHLNGIIEDKIPF